MSAARARAVLAAILLSPTLVAAQTVDEIVARHVAARGGREALAAIQTLRMTGRAIAGPARHAIVRREVARPGRIRTEFVFQGTTGVYAWDGTVGWRVSPLDGSPEPEALSDEQTALTAEQADIDGPLVGWREKGYSLELEGKDALPGGPAHRLKLTLRSGAVRRVWVDEALGLVVRTQSTRRVRGGELELETDFGDYRETAGVRFARSLETGVRGRPRRLRIVVEAVEANVPIDETRFRMPR